MQFGSQLVAWRRAHSIPRLRLAIAAGVPNSTVRSIELGCVPGSRTLARILAGAAQLAPGLDWQSLDTEAMEGRRRKRKRAA